ncbi:MAG: hypothetical protein JXR94_15285 [Candidatus Hydrogenedentes bacterium]|nr:hypothetical protein [Candidatus Hydrogenedentota bacterium]
MKTIRRRDWRRWAVPMVVALGLLSVGCPTDNPQADYDLGFLAGFALDAWYWDGYFDGYDTIDFLPIYYDDSGIPYIDALTFDAGYWDGVWYAYNDGYFVDYHYAFIIGFSEGYDNAYWPDYLAFLATDVHTEFLNGGWADGYHDGFSEGRVFGANDWEQGLPFDWLDALYDYEDGVDLYFVEVDVGTGAYGPVSLYEYGTNPLAKAAGVRRAPRDRAGTPAIRRTGGEKDVDVGTLELYRPLDAVAAADLNVLPAYSLRSYRALMLDSTWLERVNGYVAPAKNRTPHVRGRAVNQTTAE